MKNAHDQAVYRDAYRGLSFKRTRAGGYRRRSTRLNLALITAALKLWEIKKRNAHLLN